MAERSFAKEVQSLRLGEGAEFRGEGILAVTKALLQSGVAYVGGYQGAPISHLMDVLADAQDILGELGVHFEASASEAAAAAALAASVHYPIRGAATWKSTVGTNVASDALANLSSGGVTGGALIIVGEDYGEGSSIMQERSHSFAMKSQIWLLDPKPNLESIVKAVEDGFELSEATNTPVMLEVRIRSCNVLCRCSAWGSPISMSHRWCRSISSMSPIRWSMTNSFPSARTRMRCWWSRKASPIISNRPSAISCIRPRRRRDCMARASCRWPANIP